MSAPDSAPNGLTDAEIVAIRDDHLPSQGEAFDCIAFARAIERRARNQPGGAVPRGDAADQFLGWLLHEYQDGDRSGIEYDGFEMQDRLTACGLLKPTRVEKPCGDDCACAEYGEFPTDCYEWTERARELLRMYAATKAGEGET